MTDYWTGFVTGVFCCWVWMYLLGIADIRAAIKRWRKRQ